MDKQKTNKQSDKDTVAEVTEEMAKPRVAMSARKQIPLSDHVPPQLEMEKTFFR
jgi:hypothetical protein